MEIAPRKSATEERRSRAARKSGSFAIEQRKSVAHKYARNGIWQRHYSWRPRRKNGGTGRPASGEVVPVSVSSCFNHMRRGLKDGNKMALLALRIEMSRKPAACGYRSRHGNILALQAAKSLSRHLSASQSIRNERHHLRLSLMR